MSSSTPSLFTPAVQKHWTAASAAASRVRQAEAKLRANQADVRRTLLDAEVQQRLFDIDLQMDGALRTQLDELELHDRITVPKTFLDEEQYQPSFGRTPNQK